MPAKKTSKHAPACATCDLPVSDRICFSDQGRGPKGCPTLTRKALLKEANAVYLAPEVQHFAHMASVQEAAGYANRDQDPYTMQPAKTRIVEICEFARRMAYQKLGIAFCLGLAQEAAITQEIFQGYGFEVVSVCCKAGRTTKDLIKIQDQDKIFRGTDEAMCNPVFQARVLDNEGTDLNILLGLCVGHDTLFVQQTRTPTTVLAVKDRVTGHNPLAAVYQSESYYRKVRMPEVASPELFREKD